MFVLNYNNHDFYATILFEHNYMCIPFLHHENIAGICGDVKIFLFYSKIVYIIVIMKDSCCQYHYYKVLIYCATNNYFQKFRFT